MNDETLKEEIDTWIRQAYVNGSLDVNNPEPQGSDVCTELVWEAVLKDRERVVKEARIDELKNIVSPARTNKQKHLGVAYLVEDRLAELSNPTQTKKTK
jgi:hypothetical protein